MQYSHNTAQILWHCLHCFYHRMPATKDSMFAFGTLGKKHIQGLTLSIPATLIHRIEPTSFIETQQKHKTLPTCINTVLPHTVLLMCKSHFSFFVKAVVSQTVFTQAPRAEFSSTEANSFSFQLCSKKKHLKHTG